MGSPAEQTALTVIAQSLADQLVEALGPLSWLQRLRLRWFPTSRQTFINQLRSNPDAAVQELRDNPAKILQHMVNPQPKHAVLAKQLALLLQLNAASSEQPTPDNTALLANMLSHALLALIEHRRHNPVLLAQLWLTAHANPPTPEQASDNQALAERLLDVAAQSVPFALYKHVLQEFQRSHNTLPARIRRWFLGESPAEFCVSEQLRLCEAKLNHAAEDPSASDIATTEKSFLTGCFTSLLPHNKPLAYALLQARFRVLLVQNTLNGPEHESIKSMLDQLFEQNQPSQTKQEVLQDIETLLKQQNMSFASLKDLHHGSESRLGTSVPTRSRAFLAILRDALNAPTDSLKQMSLDARRTLMTTLVNASLSEQDCQTLLQFMLNNGSADPQFFECFKHILNNSTINFLAGLDQPQRALCIQQLITCWETLCKNKNTESYSAMSAIQTTLVLVFSTTRIPLTADHWLNVLNPQNHRFFSQKADAACFQGEHASKVAQLLWPGPTFPPSHHASTQDKVTAVFKQLMVWAKQPMTDDSMAFEEILTQTEKQGHLPVAAPGCAPTPRYQRSS